MELDEHISRILDDFDGARSDDIVAVLEQVRAQLRSGLTSEYLGGKLQKVADAKTESERKNLCRALVPYLDWYLEGV